MMIRTLIERCTPPLWSAKDLRILTCFDAPKDTILLVADPFFLKEGVLSWSQIASSPMMRQALQSGSAVRVINLGKG